MRAQASVRKRLPRIIRLVHDLTTKKFVRTSICSITIETLYTMPAKLAVLLLVVTIRAAFILLEREVIGSIVFLAASLIRVLSSALELRSARKELSLILISTFRQSLLKCLILIS
jgi:hypothetical protein